MNDRRQELLNSWASALDRAARVGALNDSKPIAIREIGIIAGPRAGALEIDAGFDAGRLLRSLAADDMALSRQFVPWAFIGQPAVYMQGRYIRVEAGWDDAQAQKSISVRQMNVRPNGSGHWLCGMNERGRAVVLHLSDNAPHFLVSGTTGSGKSVCLRSMVAQLSQRGDALVLIDGKFGEGLRGLEHLPGVVGPLAVDIDAARSALAWVVAEMVRRYEQGDTSADRLCVVIDEVQELISDPAIVEMIRRLSAQGRAAHVSIILATQHPTTKALGDDASIKRNVTGRIALRVSDYKASEVAIGQNSPRADWLLGAGDAYAVVPGQVQRVQIAYYDRREIERMLTAQPRIDEWPAFAAERMESQQAGQFVAHELAASLLCAATGAGRPTMVKRLEMRDGDRARRLYRMGREINDELEAAGAAVCLSGDGIHTGTGLSGVEIA
ncbi:DNA translocase SftA [Thermoflexales bacterium]|nr:DNA translocase SftA [Thermoflexales bacterium]